MTLIHFLDMKIFNKMFLCHFRIQAWFDSRPNNPNNQILYDAFIHLTAGLQDTECRLESLKYVVISLKRYK